MPEPDEIAWFRKPSAHVEGTLNVPYQLLDRSVIAGRGDEVLLHEDRGDLSHARLLEQVAAFAGALRGFGTVPGDRVLVRLPPGREALVAVLAALRLGAVAVTPDTHTDADVEETGISGPATAGARVSVEDREDGPVVGPVERPVEGAGSGAVPWKVALEAGRTDPAPAALVSESDVAVLTPAGGLSALEAARRLLQVPTPTTPVALLGRLAAPTIGR